MTQSKSGVVEDGEGDREMGGLMSAVESEDEEEERKGEEREKGGGLEESRYSQRQDTTKLAGTTYEEE